MQKINTTPHRHNLSLEQHQRAMEQAKAIGQAVALLIAKPPFLKNKLH